MLTNILVFIAGIALLLKSADYLVDGATQLARRLGISPLVVGLTVVAFGTSVPEFTVNIIASLGGEAALTVGNIVGSNISNIGLIMGLTALLYPIHIKQSTITKEIPMMLLAALVLVTAVADRYSNHGFVPDTLGRNDGVVLLLVFSVFLYYLIGVVVKQSNHKNTNQDEFKKDFRKENIQLAKIIGLIIMGLAGVILGGKLTVDSATGIATALGVSQVLIGLTVVAIGTSLPELITSLVAAKKNHDDIAVGNIVGSNIFNTLPVLGVSAIINPINFEPAWYLDLFVMLVFSLLMLVFSITYNRKIERWEGGVMLGCYIAYILFTVIRG